MAYGAVGGLRRAAEAMQARLSSPAMRNKGVMLCGDHTGLGKLLQTEGAGPRTNPCNAGAWGAVQWRTRNGAPNLASELRAPVFSRHLAASPSRTFRAHGYGVSALLCNRSLHVSREGDDRVLAEAASPDAGDQLAVPSGSEDAGLTAALGISQWFGETSSYPNIVFAQGVCCCMLKKQCITLSARCLRMFTTISTSHGRSPFLASLPASG
eukprot:762431-Hanusia_phi.AAC.3